MRGAGGGASPPHDLVHLLVEQHLGVADGIFGCIADGVVWESMRHVSGRRPPHWAERSARLQRERAESLRAAEYLAHVVHRLSCGEPILPGDPDRSGQPLPRLHDAAASLAAATARWAALRPGERWTLSWPAGGRGSSPGRRAAGRGRRPR
jgi:hypothetical protein